MKNIDIYNFLNERYPVEAACSFDNPGFLVGDGNAKVGGVLVALDCDFSAISAAEKNGCNLIISHHPVIFEPLKSVKAGTVVYELICKGISVISMHTNLDIAEGGVADCICRAAGLTEAEAYTAADGFILRSAKTAPIAAEELAAKLRAAFGAPIRFVAGSRAIESILICPGSGGSYISEAISAGFDALITGDVKHNQLVDADNAGASVFDIGHYAGEDSVTEPLAELLRSSLCVPVYTYHSERLKWSI